jgi:hypothetical protein
MDLQAMMSKKLPQAKQWVEVRRSFPETLDPLLVVIDAPTPEGARVAALGMRDALTRDTELFRAVEVPGEDPFFAQNGLLYRSTDELVELTNQLAKVQPYPPSCSATRACAGCSRCCGAASTRSSRATARW